MESSYTCNNSPKYGCSTEAGRAEAKRLGGCELHPEPVVAAEWIERAAEEAVLTLRLAMFADAGMAPLPIETDEQRAAIARDTAIIKSAIERNAK